MKSTIIDSIIALLDYHHDTGNSSSTHYWRRHPAFLLFEASGSEVTYYESYRSSALYAPTTHVPVEDHNAPHRPPVALERIYTAA